MMLIAVRFGAKCRVFWCKMRGKNKRFGQHFFVVADANLASFFFKEKCKNIVNGKKLRRKAPDVVRHFHHSGAFYIGFQGIFF
ncbi:hypothetical protein [Prevotella sp. HMSC073D09]|uniref:hypothetical protein n=1 Tax=Prevotella sp. HMSC073D09 TaxID=1739459 RepID=UPI0011131747|nr:hypothetical protein [Prevotella sp. HMSC073D09]